MKKKPTQKEVILDMLMNDKLVYQSKLPKMVVRSVVSKLRKDGLVIDCLPVISKKIRFIYELNYKKSSKKSLKRFGF